MRLFFKNIGPIRTAEIDLNKKISVFCGPNNTGKTYISYVLYAFTRLIISHPEDKLTEEQVQDFINKKYLEISFDLDRFYELMQERLNNITNDLATIFGLSEAMGKKLFPNFVLELNLDKDSYKSHVKKSQYDLNIFFQNKLLAEVKKNANSNVLVIKNKMPQIGVDEKQSIQDGLLSQIYFKMLISPVYTSHFFPVERNCLYSYYKDILINRNQLFDFLHNMEDTNRTKALNYVLQNTSKFPLVISHTLDNANMMSRLSNETGTYSSLADEIERSILKGKVSLTEDGELRFASKQAPDKIVPIPLSASMTKSISGLVFYLRHFSAEGDMLFIDEPEINCHPDTQILLTRIFAKMVRAGIRLVISTHSDYIIRELNNLIMLFNASKKMGTRLLKEMGYSKDLFLNPDELGAYLFTYGENNNVDVQSIEVTDSGFEVSTIDDTISKLNEISETLYYELRYGKEKKTKQKGDA